MVLLYLIYKDNLKIRKKQFQQFELPPEGGFCDAELAFTYFLLNLISMVSVEHLLMAPQCANAACIFQCNIKEAFANFLILSFGILTPCPIYIGQKLPTIKTEKNQNRISNLIGQLTLSQLPRTFKDHWKHFRNLLRSEKKGERDIGQIT